MSRNGPPFPQSGAPKARDLPQQKVTLDFSLGKDIQCEKCGNFTFEEVSLLKHYSELVSPTGKAINVPIPTFACNHCGHVNDAFLPQGYFGNQPGATSSEPETKTEATKPLIDIVR